jgi:hypothetical protein
MSDMRELGHHAEGSGEWAIYQCRNGCVHVRLQHVTLSFSPCEFSQLAALFEQACVRLGLPSGGATTQPH